MAHRLTTCTFCGVGCGLYLETAGDRIIGVYPSVSHPTNAGRICVRGWHVHEIANSSDRLIQPLIRENGNLRPAEWDEALDLIANRLRLISERDGPDALAFVASPRCSNEEGYLLQKLARAVVGTNNIDHGSGVYGNNSLDVLQEMIGVPAASNSIADLAGTEVILLDGMDLARRMPTIAGAVIRAKLAGSKLIVCGTRRHRLVENADMFLQIRPGTETFLFGAMAKAILDRGLQNHRFVQSRCRDYAAFAESAREYDLLQAAEICNVPAESIEGAAIACAQARSAAFLYSTSMEDRTHHSVAALVDLAMLTGNLGRPNGGLFALSEHNNLQGICDVGVLPSHLPGYRDVENPAARAALGTLWQAHLPEKPGVSARSALHDRAAGKIKAMWLCRCDPLTTAFFGDARHALHDLDFLVVQHLFMTGSATAAHVVLPTTAFGEEEVSFTSTERRIQVTAQAVPPPASQRPAWQQIADVARRLGADWCYRNAADVMDEITEAVPFYGGAQYQNLKRSFGRQWPCTHDHPMGTPHLFMRPEKTLSGDRPFKFVSVAKPSVLAEAGGAEFPLTLVMGHSLYYWHQNVLIAHSETLRREHRILLLDYPRGFVEINQEDARKLNIRDGQTVAIHAATGHCISSARLTEEVPSGSVFAPFFLREIEQQLVGSVDPEHKLLPVRLEVAA